MTAATRYIMEMNAGTAGCRIYREKEIWMTRRAHVSRLVRKHWAMELSSLWFTQSKYHHGHWNNENFKREISEKKWGEAYQRAGR